MGSYRSKPDLSKHSLRKSQGDLIYAVSHMCGWRLYMEDAHISISPFANNENLSLFAIFDGHGGPEVAIYSAKHFPEELQKNVNFGAGKYEEALRQTFLKIDQLLKTPKGEEEIRIIQKQQREKQNADQNQEKSHAGCTANVVLITLTTIYCANAGDSRSVSLTNSQTVELSSDHKPQNPIELQRIRKAGGIVNYGRVNGGLNLSRALGDLEYKNNESLPAQEQMITANPDIKTIPNKNVQFIIMGCDGIWEVKSNNQMVNWINRRLAEKNQGEILDQLLDQLVSKDSVGKFGLDNMSSILIRFKK